MFVQNCGSVDLKRLTRTSAPDRNRRGMAEGSAVRESNKRTQTSRAAETDSERLTRTA